MISQVPLLSRKVNLEWVGNLELLEVNDPPKSLPGRLGAQNLDPGRRLVIRDAKDSDPVCFYERIKQGFHQWLAPLPPRQHWRPGTLSHQRRG